MTLDSFLELIFDCFFIALKAFLTLVTILFFFLLLWIMKEPFEELVLDLVLLLKIP